MPEIFADATLTPNEIVAAETVEFIVKLVIGQDYTPDASRLVFDFSSTLGTSCPTRFVNEAAGYIEVYVSNPHVTYAQRCWDLDLQDFAKCDRPPSREAQRMAVLDLSEGLKAGDVVELHWGDTYGGFGPGAKVTSVVPRPGWQGSINVRYFSDPEAGMPDRGAIWEGYQRPVPDTEVPLLYTVRPRPPHHFRLIRKEDHALLIPHDMFWNVADINDLSEWVEAPEDHEKNAMNVVVYRDKNVHVRSKGLPLRGTPPMEDLYGDMNLYWGDVHTHSAFSIDCIQRARMDMTPSDLMVFARHRAGLDFYAVTDHHQPQGEPHHLLGTDYWDRTMDAVLEHHRPGEFVVFPGIEYRARRGDTVALFNWVPSYAEIKRPEWTDIRALWQDLAGRDFMTIPHFHSPGSLPEGEWWWPEDMKHEPVLEIFSDHGSYEREDIVENGRALCKRFRPDRCGVHFLKSGFRYGFVANSDDHKGHVGVNGVTAVFSASLDRDALLDAYRKRHVYGTSNARIRLLFTGNGQLMGSEIPRTGDEELNIDVVGENTLKKVELFRNGDLFQRFVPEGITFQTTVRVQEDSSTNWYVRVTQLDNHIAISSPIWFD